jgi:signal transduction histidine kinase
MSRRTEGHRGRQRERARPGWRARICCLIGLLGLSGLAAAANPDPIRKVIHQYALTSANDFPARDPQDWRLVGSNDGGVTWTTLDVRQNEVFPARQQRKLYKTTNETAYELYRLQIDRVRDPVTASSVQLAELELMGATEAERGPEPRFTDVITAQGENLMAERVANLFDRRADTKWLDFSGDPQTRSSWVQWQYAEPVKKTISLYALTSANDFPQRDPQAWRLLASNDGGVAWDTLDVRTYELFTDRQQRKLYHTTNTSAYIMYRLQIDRVRDPHSASSVQLAELELMGTNELDHRPEPVFTDVVSAMGDNPSAETVRCLFDGQVETKWLYFSSNELTRGSWIQWQYAASGYNAVTNVSQLVGLRTRASEGFPARLAVVVVGATGPGGRMSVMDATGCLEVEGGAGATHWAAGEAVLLTGTSTWTGQEAGLKVTQARVLDPPAGRAAVKTTGQSSFGPGEPARRLERVGEVHYPHWTRNEFSCDLVTEAQSLRVHWRVSDPAPGYLAAGTRVAVSGLGTGAFDESGHWVLADLWAAGREAVRRAAAGGQVTEPNRPAANPPAEVAGPMTLTKIEQIRQLTKRQINDRPRVKIRGVITGLLGGFIQDNTAGIEVVFPAEASRKLTTLGTYIEVEGSVELAEVGNRIVVADHLVLLGRGRLPQPQRLPLNQLLSGQVDAQWLEMEGMVRSTDGSHMLVLCDGRELMATVGEAAAGQVRSLVDAEVRVRGVGVAAMDEQGRIQGMNLLIPSLEDVEVVEAPIDPGKLPVRPIGTLLGQSGPREFVHRVKVEGVVTLQENQKVYLQDDSGSAMAIFKEEVVLDANFGRARWLYWRTPPKNAAIPADMVFQPGERIQVVGFPETYRYSPVLTEVTLNRLGPGPAVMPMPLTINGIQEGALDASLVSLEGVLRGETTIGTHSILALEWEDRTMQVLLPELTKPGASQIALGSRLRVTGVCQVDPAPYPELGLGVGAVRIQTRGEGDLVVLSRPAWWTVGRALTVMGGMALGTLAALVWVKELRRQVKEQTARLAAEIQLHEQTEHHRALEQERGRIAKDLHDDLGANLTQIVFLSERVEVARHDGQDTTHWFDLIPATARRTIQSLDEIVWAINPRHDSLESLANYLSQFAQQHLALAGMRCVLDVPMVLPAVPLSADVRHNLLLTTREALQNAVTHAAATVVRLTLKLEADGITIVIADNGKGFEPAQVGTKGNGLENMRCRLQAIGGRLEITSQPGQGTRVSLNVPRELLHGRVIGKPEVSRQDI